MDVEIIINYVLIELWMKGLNIVGFVGIGIDGVNVMIGKKSGVVVRFWEYSFILIGIYCVVYRCVLVVL